MKRVCVFAGSSAGARAEYAAAAHELGQVLVQRGLSLVYGGGRVGLMGVLADAVMSGGGHVIGVIPQALAAKEIAHSGLSDLRIVGSMHERKALMADLSDGFVALPGGWGTLEEFFEAWTAGYLGMHDKPVVMLDPFGHYDGLRAWLNSLFDSGLEVQKNYQKSMEAIFDSYLKPVADKPAPKPASPRKK